MSRKDRAVLIELLRRENIGPLLNYQHDLAGFVRDCFIWGPGEGPTPYQEEILKALPMRRRVAVRGPHGLGKTALASWVILWFALTRDGRDWKAVSTASGWRQLIRYLWPEIHKWARRLNWEKVGRDPFTRFELLDQTLKLSTGEAFAVASDTPDLIEGAHAEQLLYVFDEAKAIPPDTWDAAEGAFSAGECYALTISTPGEPSGRFYDIHSRKPGFEDWWTRHVSIDECIAAGRVNPDWVKQREAQWGRESAVFCRRVLGEFASGEECSIIPLAWVEAANERWRQWKDTGLSSPLETLGVDVARSGEDQTCYALRCAGNVVSEIRLHSRQDTMQTTGQVAGILRGEGGRAVVDVIGIGAGVFDRLKEQGLAVTAFNASEHTDAKDRSGELGFANKRAAAWWGLREMLDPANAEGIALPPDDQLVGDLTAPQWKVTSSGKIQVESKEEIKARLGRSPDAGDAVVMAFWREKEPAKWLFV